MPWNWEQKDWGAFRWDESRLRRAEERFGRGAGVLIGTVTHLAAEDRERITVDVMSTEATTTSEIEGEILERASIQSSIRRQLGLTADPVRARPAEEGISEVVVDVYRNFADPLSHDSLFDWHRLITKGRSDLRDVGRYRTHAEPMQVVSGAVYQPRVHFEAPPSERVSPEMERFVAWFNGTAPNVLGALPALTRAGIAHLYFECIHPFEDGNGRIGRAISEKALAQALERPSLTALAATILNRRREYYDALEAANKSNEVTEWLAWFAGVALEAQSRALASVEFVIDKTRLLERYKGLLTERQEKVLLRVLREGPAGFTGGLSAGKYVAIAKTSPATARRDLGELVELGVLERTGEKKGARYHPAIPKRVVPRVTIDERGEIVESEPAS